MKEGVLVDNKVIVKDGKEIYENNWYGEIDENGNLVLDLIEALLLAERERIKVKSGNKTLALRDIVDLGLSFDSKFFVKYLVYKDLRTRGLPVRIGAEGVDFFVYERGSKPGRKRKLIWILFVYSENDLCELDELERTAKLGKNLRTKTVWAIVDGDNDITYYIVNEKREL